MKILLNSDEIREAIRDIQPQKIAVAYIGIDFEDFIDTSVLQSIIISPTLGSNPEAIGNIASQINWENVSFLDNLHSKIYIGENSAVITSANLSANALSNKRLFESGVLISDKESVEIIKKQFISYWNESKKKYPSLKAKKKKLQKLHNDFKRFKKYFSKKMLDKRSTVGFDKYSIDKHGDFLIVWWYPDDTPLIENEIRKNIYLSEDQNINELICYLFSPKDNIKENNWILTWKITANDKVSKSANLQWIYIDKIVPNGANHEIFSTAAFQLNYDLEEPPPFRIDKKFKEAFSKVIENKKYENFRGFYRNEWYWNDCAPLFEDLIEDIRKEY